MNWSEAVRLAKEGKEEGYNFYMSRPIRRATILH